MIELATKVVTHTGFKFYIRPVRPDDEAALRDFFRYVTPEDMRFRFLGSVKEVSHERLRAMIDVDHHQIESYVALEHEGAPIIAAAMLVSNEAFKTGEVGISIRADFKRRGISWEMLRHVCNSAKARGLRSIQSIEDRANQSAISLEQDMGFSLRAVPDDSTLLLLQKTLG